MLVQGGIKISQSALFVNRVRMVSHVSWARLTGVLATNWGGGGPCCFKGQQSFTKRDVIINVDFHHVL